MRPVTLPLNHKLRMPQAGGSSLPPHPYPLPRGEEEPFGSASTDRSRGRFMVPIYLSRMEAAPEPSYAHSLLVAAQITLRRGATPDRFAPALENCACCSLPASVKDIWKFHIVPFHRGFASTTERGIYSASVRLDQTQTRPLHLPLL